MTELKDGLVIRFSAGDVFMAGGSTHRLTVKPSQVHPGRFIAVNESGLGFELTASGGIKFTQPDQAFGQFAPDVNDGTLAVFPEVDRVAKWFAVAEDQR